MALAVHEAFSARNAQFRPSKRLKPSHDGRAEIFRKIFLLRNSRSKNLPSFLFHRAVTPSRSKTQQTLRSLIKVSYGDASHTIMLSIDCSMVNTAPFLSEG